MPSDRSRSLDDSAGRVLFFGAVATVMLGLSWVALDAASIARRRIRLTTQQPIETLWDTIGAAGDTPRDHSHSFAAIAIVLLAVAAIAVPIIATALFVG